MDLKKLVDEQSSKLADRLGIGEGNRKKVDIEIEMYYLACSILRQLEIELDTKFPPKDKGT